MYNIAEQTAGPKRKSWLGGGEELRMALEKQEPRELYDPEQVRRVVENVEDPETKAILYLAWETALTATEISSLPAGARESCAATLSGERVGSISKNMLPNA